jgi:hypothetical protein
MYVLIILKNPQIDQVIIITIEEAINFFNCINHLYKFSVKSNSTTFSLDIIPQIYYDGDNSYENIKTILYQMF